MLTALIIVSLIGILCTLSYYSSAWFGCRASDGHPFVQQYHRQPPTRQPEEANNVPGQAKEPVQAA